MLENGMIAGYSPEEEESVVATCAMCECNLYEGEEVYEINGEYICENCIADYYEEFKTRLWGEIWRSYMN